MSLIDVEVKERRLKAVLQRPAVQGFLWGLGTAAMASYVWPRVKGKVRPVVVGALSEVLSLTDTAMESAMHMKEDLEDIVAEAKARQSGPSGAPESGMARVAAHESEDQSELQQLRASVHQLQNRLHEMEEVRAEIRELKQLLRQASGRAEET